MLENFLEYYRKSAYTTKEKILGCNSSKKLRFSKKKVATFSLKNTVHLILRISEGFRM
jgi:hypothetical protein